MTIIMILDRQSLDDKLILNDAARTAKLYKDYIPYIEVWCKEDVPVSAVTACIVLCNVGQGEFSLLNGNHRLVALVDQKVNEFQAKYADAYEKEVEAKGVLENLFRKKALN